LRELNPKSITEVLNKWIFSLSRITVIQPTFIFGDDFEKLVSEKLPKKLLLNERISYNRDSGLFDYLVDERKTRVDTIDLQVKLITFSDFGDRSISAEMISESNELEKRVDKVNKNLTAVFKNPLEISIQGVDGKLSLNPNEMLGLLEVKTKDFLNTVDLSVKNEEVKQLLADNGINNMSTEWTAKVIKDNLKARYNGGLVEPLVLGADMGPNSDGSLADKYIEVDLSQQKMYFFENGNLFKDYNVSTGLNYPTPVGSYKIKNKLPIGFSAIFNVWMPWWMAFEYAEDIGAYLGIHELPYKLVGGEKIYRFGNYIGNRKTGGCVALAPGDAKEVYDKSYPGMDVVIFK
jgi:hypothetical protein